MTYRVDENGWTWIPVIDILQNACDSIDYPDGFSFEYMLEEKCADTGFMHLVNSIIEHGWKSAIGYNPEDGYISEGHHRLCAAILLFEEEIPTTINSTDWLADGSMYRDRISAHSNWSDPQPFYIWEE